MKGILVVGEDALCCSLGERLVAAALPGWTLANPPIDTRGVTNLVARPGRYAQQARHVQPVLCIADADRHCAARLVALWLPRSAPGELLLRIAVPEAESWVMADRSGFAAEFRVARNKIPHDLDEIADPKALLLTLAARSAIRRYRDEMVSASSQAKAGAGYNLHLTRFVRDRWDVQAAQQCSGSLRRALSRLKALNAMD